MSLLSVIQASCRRLAIPVPTAIVSSANAQVLQLWQLANLEVTELSERYDWSILVKQHGWTATATEDQPLSVPDAFGHYIIDSMWNRTTQRKCFGPLTSADWEQIKSYPIYTSINPVFRLFQPSSDGTVAGYVQLVPTPVAGNLFYYQYASRFPIIADGGTEGTKAQYEADTDFCAISELIVQRGVTWRFLQAKGFDYAQEFALYEQMIARTQAQDGGGKPRLSLVRGLGARDIWPANIPAGNWPG